MQRFDVVPVRYFFFLRELIFFLTFETLPKPDIIQIKRSCLYWTEIEHCLWILVKQWEILCTLSNCSSQGFRSTPLSWLKISKFLCKVPTFPPLHNSFLCPKLRLRFCGWNFSWFWFEAKFDRWLGYEGTYANKLHLNGQWSYLQFQSFYAYFNSINILFIY